MKYANIIVDISVEKLDKTFQYSIPENLQEEIQVGVQVDIPFGNRKLTGYVIELTEDAEFDPRRIRPIISVHEGSVAMESQLIALAGWSVMIADMSSHCQRSVHPAAVNI